MHTLMGKAEFAERFRFNVAYRRRQLQLTQQNVAARAKMTVTGYATIERGERLPNIYTAAKVAAALCTSVSALIGEP